MDRKIKSTIALVTGGASGIGKAIASRIVDKGGRVTILDLNPAGQEVANSFGDRAIFFKGDVTSEKDTKDAIDFAKKTFGGLNAVVNAAGDVILEELPYNFQPDEPRSIGTFKKMMDVNAFGTFNVSRLSAAVLAANEPDENNQRGVIINISSISAFDASMHAVAYAASKGAVVAMTLPMARAYASKGIRVVSIAPGHIDTPLITRLKKVSKIVLSNVELRNLSPKRMGKPEEIAHMVQCVIENPFLNAEVVRVDGGSRNIAPVTN